MEPLQERQADRVGEAIAAYRECCVALKADTLWPVLDLSIHQLKCLVVLDAREMMTVGQLGAALRLGRQSSSILVDSLVRIDLLRRLEDRTDRRRTHVLLTVGASDLLDRFFVGGREQIRRHIECLCESDLAALLQGLRALVAVVDENFRKERSV